MSIKKVLILHLFLFPVSGLTQTDDSEIKVDGLKVNLYKSEGQIKNSVTKVDDSESEDSNLTEELNNKLLYSVRFLSFEKIRPLLILGADPNARDIRLNTPLHHAVERNNSDSLKIIHLLLKYGAEPDLENEFGDLPLHGAALFNKDPAVHEALLEYGADVNSRGEGDNTALHRAVRSNKNPDVFKFLLQKGADLKAKNKAGFTPLELAENNKKFKVADILRKYACRKSFD